MYFSRFDPMFFKRQKQPDAHTAISRQKDDLAGRLVGVAFFSVFLLMGLGFFYVMLVRPLVQIQAARGWIETPCEIVSSQVGVHHGDDTTYSIDIAYKYEAGGREYQSDRYHFASGSSSGRSGKQAVVDRYPPGKKTVCYVDPDDPTEAVIQREFTADLWFGLFPLIFVLVGAAGLLGTTGLIKIGSRKTSQAGYLPAQKFGRSGRAGWKAELPVQAGPVTLKPQWSRWGKLLGVVCLALFWNGIVSIFLRQVVQGFQAGRPEWFLTLFMIPFVLVGLALIGGIGYVALSMLNPRPTLTLSQASVVLGGTMRLEWKFDGRTRVRRRLHIHLRGEESASYRRGTDTYTDTEEFAGFTLLDTLDPLEMTEGNVLVRVPQDTMHSFDGGNNKIQWSLRVEGEIRRWPDVKETFPIVVLPRPIKEAVGA
jgi:hypothetical protein